MSTEGDNPVPDTDVESPVESPIESPIESNLEAGPDFVESEVEQTEAPTETAKVEPEEKPVETEKEFDPDEVAKEEYSMIEKALAGLFAIATLALLIVVVVLVAGLDKEVASPASGVVSSVVEEEVAVIRKPPVLETNYCEGKKPKDAFTDGDKYFYNTECMTEDGQMNVLEQAGGNVTKGYKGSFDAGDRVPILEPYWKMGMCPVNVHWHLGAEHLSEGEYDENGKGPSTDKYDEDKGERRGNRCHYYDESDPKFTTPYEWKHCVGMIVGETYEVHWPHSAAGACGTPYQYQTPFYDGVFCNNGIISLDPLNTYQKIGVQGQIYTIVNDEDYYYPDLMRGMIVSGDIGKEITKYTGSTTGTSRDNEVCSRYTPITWQVDRECHMVSASSFDKMCADMMAQADDMSLDLHAHGARITTADYITADNQHNRLRYKA